MVINKKFCLLSHNQGTEHQEMKHRSKVLLPSIGIKEFFPAALLDMAKKATEEVDKGTLF